MAAHGLPAADLIAAAGQPSVAEALANESRAAAQAGVFGVPTLRVADELFFGNDRLDFVREAIIGARAREGVA